VPLLPTTSWACPLGLLLARRCSGRALLDSSKTLPDAWMAVRDRGHIAESVAVVDRGRVSQRDRRSVSCGRSHASRNGIASHLKKIGPGLREDVAWKDLATRALLVDNHVVQK